MKEKRKRIATLQFENGESIQLCDSEPTVDPDQAGVGFKSRKTVVWVRSGGEGPWLRTGHKSHLKAMDAVLRFSTAGQAVEALVASADVVVERPEPRAIGGLR